MRTLPVFDHRSRADVGFIQSFKAGELRASAGTTIVCEGLPNERLFTVLSGWVFRYRTLDDGRRQIINYGLPGDLLGLQATLDDVLGHGIEAASDVVLCYFEQSRLWDLFSAHPRLSYDLTWLAAQQERSFEEHLLTLGQRTAMERVAYLLWRLFDRARDVGLVKESTIAFPVRQQQLADTLGLSLVHTNKTLQKVRESGAVEVGRSHLVVHDENVLKVLGRVPHAPFDTRPLL